MILAAYRHGLRASELADLRCDQVDFGTATLHVRRPAFLFLAACELLVAICFFFAPETKDATLVLDDDSTESGEATPFEPASRKTAAL